MAKRISRREQQRIATTKTKHGSDAFKRFGSKGGRGNKIKRG